MIAALAAIGAIVTAALIFRWVDERSGPPIVIDAPTAENTILVSVSGAVATPGLYSLPSGARYQDAIAAAGGLRADADPGLVNMARRVYDEDQVIVPVLKPTPDNPDSATDEPEGPVSLARAMNLNTATAEQLTTLPGIGPVLAQRIVETRDARGGFSSVDELDDVPGISERILEQLRPLVTVQP